MTPEAQAREVRRVKKYESGVISDPITVGPDQTIRAVLALTREKNISGMPVVDGDQLVGIVTHRDLRFETRLDAPVSAVMTPQDKLVACFEVTDDSHPLADLMTIGRITPQGVEIDEEARLRLRQKIVERLASCRDCFCYWTCAGGCLPRTLSPGPDGHLEHGAHCEMRRTLLREMLLRGIAAGDGRLERTPQPVFAAEIMP